MKEKEMLLQTAFDPCKDAILNPNAIVKPLDCFPEVTISCFARSLFERICSTFHARLLNTIHSAGVENPIYEIVYKGKRFAFYQSCVGEPKCIADYEELIAMGSKRLILFGNCGILDKDYEHYDIIIPNEALRDEGSSYHYAPPNDTIAVNKKYRNQMISLCKQHGYNYAEGITWTTDAIYRETKAKIADRKKRGAICVEMECAGMQALCDFRNTEFFTFFYSGDTLANGIWDPRTISDASDLSHKEQIALLALELGYYILAS